ncbi:MAG: cyclic nucleotide-binding domain-containing protein [Pseudomonadota bacterium]
MMQEAARVWEVVLAGGLLHLGFATVALAYLFRDMLHLRVVAALGYALFLAHTLPQGSAEALVAGGWYVAFLLVNLGHALMLAYQRRCDSLTAEERRLTATALASLDVGAARRMMRRGTWLDLAPGTRLTQRGERGTRLYALLRGRVDVEIDGVAVAEAGPGEFVGEIGFLANGPATATATAAGPVRALVWDRDELERAIRRSPELHATVHAAFGSDLARKVATQSLRPRAGLPDSRPAEAERAESA